MQNARLQFVINLNLMLGYMLPMLQYTERSTVIDDALLYSMRLVCVRRADCGFYCFQWKSVGKQMSERVRNPRRFLCLPVFVERILWGVHYRPRSIHL